MKSSTRSERRQTVERLLAERQAQRMSATASPSDSMQSTTVDRYERVQQLLAQRRAQQQSGVERQHSLLSPDSTFTGQPCDVSSTGKESVPRDTPYAHRRRSEQSSSSRQEGASFHACAAALGTDTSRQAEVATRREHSLNDDKAGSGGRSSSSKGAPPADLDALSMVSRLDSAMDQALASQYWACTQPPPQQQLPCSEADTPAAQRASPDDLLSPLSLPSNGISQKAEAFIETAAANDVVDHGWGNLYSPADERPQQHSGAQVGQLASAEEIFAPPRWPAWEAQRAPGAAQHDKSMPEPWPGQELGPSAQPEQKEDAAAPPADCGAQEGMFWREARKVGHDNDDAGARRGTAPADALLAALAAGAGMDGPIELDTCMLYSPASTSGQTAETAGPSAAEECPREDEGGEQGMTVAAHTEGMRGNADVGGRISQASLQRSSSAPRERPARRSTTPTEFRLSDAHPAKSRTALAERILAERRRDMPFRPRLMSGARGSREDPPSPSDPEGGRRAARISRLAQPRMQLWAACAQRKQEEEGGQLAECSFRPVTGRGPVTGPRATVAGLPAPRRLYAAHDAKYTQWQRLRAEREAERLRDCTFAPTLVTPPRPALCAQLPLHRRLAELQRRRSERLAGARVAAELGGDAELTFSPAINERSLRLALVREIRQLRDCLPASARLAARAPDGATAGAKQGAAGSQQVPFAPTVCPASTRILEDSADVPSRFLERQRHFHDLRQRRLRLIQAEDDSDCTFCPDTRSSAAGVPSVSPACEKESALEQAERLAKGDKQRIESSRAAAAHTYYSNFTFQPCISERSRRLVRPQPLAELTRSDRARQNREAMAAEAEEKLLAECTFKPRLLTRSRSPASSSENHDPQEQARSLTRRIAAYRERRQAQLEEQRASRDVQELQQCTFAPTIMPRPRVPQAPVVVHGLDAYMANMDHARQLEDEQRAREDKAFCLHPQPRTEPFTVPRPFALHTQLREEEMADRRSQLRANVMAEALKECTFHPRTKEGANRQLIQRILAGDETDSTGQASSFEGSSLGMTVLQDAEVSSGA